MNWKTYKFHQRTGWVNFRDEVKECRHLAKYYYDNSDKKTKCSKCKKEVV